MSAIKEWSTVAADNDAVSPDGWPENMDKAGVNDSARENMAALRVAFETFPWVNLVKAADIVSKLTDDSIQIAGADYTGLFDQGDRVRIYDGGTFIERMVESVAFGPNTVISLVVETPVVQAGANQIEFHASRVGTAGYRDMGTGAGEVLTLTDLADGSQVDMGDGNGFDADTVDGQHYQDILDVIAGHNPTNMLVNSEFRTWREGLSFTSLADLTYVCDQWKMLVESGNHNAARSSNVPAGALNSIAITHQSGAQAAIYQMVERDNMAQAIGVVCSLSFKVKGGAQAPDVIRYAIIEWTGAKNACTAAAITTWPVSEGTDPTLAASFNIIGSGQITLDGSWQSVALLNKTVDSNAKNIGVMFWVDDQDISVGDEWFLTQVKLESAALVSGFIHPSKVDHLLQLDHYWRKTFSEEQAPAHNIESATAPVWGVNNQGDGWLQMIFSPPMLKSGTVTYYNPLEASPGSDFFRDITDGTNQALSSERITALRLSAKPAKVGPSNDDEFIVHAVIDARFF